MDLDDLITPPERVRDSDKIPDARWITPDGTNEEEKKKTRRLLRQNTIIFDRLRKIIEDEFNATVLDSQRDISDQNWVLKEAYSRGYRKALKRIYNSLP